MPPRPSRNSASTAAAGAALVTDPTDREILLRWAVPSALPAPEASPAGAERPTTGRGLWILSAVLLLFLPYMKTNPFLAVWVLALPAVAFRNASGLLRFYLLAGLVAGIAWPEIAPRVDGLLWGREGILLLPALLPLVRLARGVGGGGLRIRPRPAIAAAAGAGLALFPHLEVWLFPLAWLTPVPLAWLALEPMRPRVRTALAWLVHGLGYAACFAWLRHTSPGVIVFIALVVGAFGLPAVYGIRWLTVWGRLPLCLSVPLSLVAVDFLRAHFLWGLPMYFLGHAPVFWNDFAQVADLGGAYGMTAIVTFGGGVLADIALRRRWGWPIVAIRRRPRFWIPPAVAVLLVAAACAYGVRRLAEVRALTREGPTLLILQGNIAQDLKNLSKDPGERDRMSQKVAGIQMALMKRNLDPRPDLVVWPETAFPWALPYDTSLGRYPEPAGTRDPSPGRFGWDLLREISATARAPCLVGLLYVEPDATAPPYFRWDTSRAAMYNSALLVGTDGTLGPRYDKLRLVPFSESLPLHGRSEALDAFSRWLSGVDIDPLTAGREPVLMTLGGHGFGVLICYESIFADLVRDYARRGASFVVNLSNDGWFRESIELDQMLYLTSLRAIESRVGIVRATNTGISAFIAPTGEIRGVVQDGGRTKSVEGALRRAVDLGPGDSFYVRNGDLFAGVVSSLAVAGLLASAVRRFRSRPPGAGGG